MQKERTPVHLRIRGALLDRIQHAPPNARLPTELALAAEFGVSRLTVHKVMARLQQEGLVVRRGKGGTFVAREAHRVQRSGCRGRNGELVIAYPNWFSYDFWFKVDMAERLALQNGMTPLLVKINPDTAMADLGAMVGAEKPRGLLLLPPGDTVGRSELAALDRLGCPCVVLAAHDGVEETSRVYSVAQDYRQIGFAGVSLLFAHGHRRIAYASEEPWRQAGQLVYAGMRDAFRAQGVSVRHLLRPWQRVNAWEDTGEAGYRATARLLDLAQPPTAIIFDALSGAHAGMRVLREAGIAVPDAMSLVVNSGAHPFARYDWPRLATVCTPVGRLVEQAVEIVLRPPRQHIFRFGVQATPAESVVRLKETSRAPRACRAHARGAAAGTG